MISTRQLIKLSPELRKEISEVQTPGDSTADVVRKLFKSRAVAAQAAACLEGEKSNLKEEKLKVTIIC